MQKVRLAFATLALIVIGGFSRGENTTSFRRDIAPVFIDNCIACHGPKKAEGNYRVDSFAKLILAGDSEAVPVTANKIDQSELLRRLTTSDKGERMPLDSDPLTADQIAAVRRWIEEGANYDGPAPDALLANIVPPPVYSPAPTSYASSIPITALAITPDGKQLVVGGYHELTVWDMQTGKLDRRIGNIGQRVHSLAFNSDGKTLAVGCGTPGRLGEVRIVDFETGKILKVLGTTSDVVFDVMFSPDGKRLAAGSADAMIRIFDATTGELQRTIASHSDWILALAWNSDGSKLAAASRDKTAKVFDANNGDLLVTYSGHNQPVKGIVFHPDGNEVFSAGADNKMHRWKVADAAKTADVSFGGEVIALLRGDDALFATSSDKSVRQFEAASQKAVRTLSGHTDWVLSADFHSSTKKLATGAFDGEVRIWSVADGTLANSWKAIPK